MEKYTDKYHPHYVPGTYSIYTSALIRKKREQQLKKKSQSANNLYNSYQTSEQQQLQRSFLSNNYNYKYSPKTPLEGIPDIKSRYGVILLPQPTNSQADPLNWSSLRKSLHFFMLILITAFTAAIANDASAPQDSINEITDVSYDALNNSAGILFASIGLSTWFYAPLSSMLGRRITYIIGMIFAVAGSVWYAKIGSVGDVFGSQVLIGISEGCTEAQVPLSLSSIFFRHQLGAVITIYVLAYALGTYLGPLVANYISSAHNFRWVGWSGAIASAILLVMVLLLVEEDIFDYSVFKNHRENLLLKFSFLQFGIASNSNDDVDLGYSDKPWPIKKRLAITTNISHKNHNSIMDFVRQYFKLLFLNLKCLSFPPVLLAGLTWGLQNAILSFYLTTEDTYLYDPPFNYSSSRVALMNVPCLIGAIIGCLYAGSITDYFILSLARKKRGIVESEYRLYFSFLSGIIGSVGLLMFGFGISRHLNWKVHYAGLILIGYLFSSSGNISLLYVIDTYDQLILESLVMVSLVYNLIGCAFTFACSPWLDSSGTENTYIALAVLNLFVMFLALPFILWGKKWRKMTKQIYIDVIEARSQF